MTRCLSCRGKADDDDFGSMKFPATNAAFTPDGERIHSSPSSLRVLPQHRPRLLGPVLAAILAFMTYTETSKQFDVAIVCASFSLFQVGGFSFCLFIMIPFFVFVFAWLRFARCCGKGKARFSLASSQTLVASSSYLYRSFQFCYSTSAPFPLADVDSLSLVLYFSFFPSFSRFYYPY
jgi:hypothetical protein